MKQALLTLVALTLLACGSQTSASGAATTDDTSSGSSDTAEPSSAATEDSESCGGFSPGDACATDENLAQCREMEAQCPGRVTVLESCPVRFACP